MGDQLFKTDVPYDILDDFLQSCTDDTNAFGKDAYKKACLSGSINIFLDRLKDYYFTSKQIYITRKMSYKNIVTIIRHVCNHLNVQYTSKIFYTRSSYEIVYYIKPLIVLTDIITNKQLSHNGIAF
jgi:hypothetical protein